MFLMNMAMGKLKEFSEYIPPEFEIYLEDFTRHWLKSPDKILVLDFKGKKSPFIFCQIDLGGGGNQTNPSFST